MENIFVFLMEQVGFIVFSKPCKFVPSDDEWSPEVIEPQTITKSNPWVKTDYGQTSNDFFEIDGIFENWENCVEDVTLKKISTHDLRLEKGKLNLYQTGLDPNNDGLGGKWDEDFVKSYPEMFTDRLMQSFGDLSNFDDAWMAMERLEANNRYNVAEANKAMRK